jgi:hypothetical protein
VASRQQKPKQVSGARPTQIGGNNPKDRYGLSKVSFSVLPTSSLIVMEAAMRSGEEDYGFQNYRVEPVQARVYLDAAARHLQALIDGEDIDPKRGVHHAGFVMATIGVYLDALHHGNLIDNRVIPGRTGELIDLFNYPPGEKLSPKEMHQRYQDFINRAARTEYALAIGENKSSSVVEGTLVCGGTIGKKKGARRARR